jgi:Mn-containing catalase
MFRHDKRLQYYTRPDAPDPILAKKMQELIGGVYGEVTVALQYFFQGMNCRGPVKYRDMLLDIATEEFGHIEILATLVADLLEKAPVSDQEEGAADALVGAVMGGRSTREIIESMNPQHAIFSGLGAMVADSTGVPWNGRFVTASGNLLADFRSNLNAESQGRLQAVRIYEMTADKGVRDTLSFLIARDTMHQNQWLAAIEDIEASGLDRTPVPASFPIELEKREVAYQFWNLSSGSESRTGRWASGPSMDGKGEFEYLVNPEPLSSEPIPPTTNPRLHGTDTTTANAAVNSAPKDGDGTIETSVAAGNS